MTTAESVPGPALPPVSGAWRAGDDPGRRQFAELGNLELERIGTFGPVHLAYETWGELSPSGDNAVLVVHALTADSHVTGPAGPGHVTPGWWDELIGPGRPLDTDRWFVVAPNVLGGCQGSTGPSSDAPDGRPYGSRFPYLTVRDQVEAERLLADHLELDRWALVAGGSMGGMRAIEWAVTHPGRVERLFLVATTAAATGDQIAWCAGQLAAIRGDANFRNGDYYDARPGHGPHLGMGVARRIAHATYRSETEINLRFGRRPQTGEDPLGGGGRWAVESYLDHHADKLAHRFDANSYVVLTEAMNSHDVGRGRGGVAAALARVIAKTAVAAIDSDRLYTPRQNAEIAAGIPDCPPMRLIPSPYGHDGFLIESGEVGKILDELLDD
jgi:homoserine O-acetyltransferase